ncbi:hypothetical protein QYE76_065011 [Lolium multiflorum]|uniref:Reverse transcriptase Ty1/copia-type domain-containing protein n=1 Tax=Lolium multiflorum TaxID=4521 RepID=A0AAD8W896_LOLMU|nr:hypothetical protein QYE76_065011 [Lolium multiflorum]
MDVRLLRSGFNSSSSGSSNPFAGPPAVIRDIPIAERVPLKLSTRCQLLPVEDVLRASLPRTVSNDIFRTVVRDGDSAHTVWVKITGLFTDNKIQRVTFLQQEFFGTHQNDMSLDDYALKLKSLSDELRDLEFPIDDKIMLSTPVGGSRRGSQQCRLQPHAPRHAHLRAGCGLPAPRGAPPQASPGSGGSHRLRRRLLPWRFGSCAPRTRASPLGSAAGLPCSRSPGRPDRPLDRPVRSAGRPDRALDRHAGAQSVRPAPGPGRRLLPAVVVAAVVAVAVAAMVVTLVPLPLRLVRLSTPPLRHGPPVTIRGPGLFTPTPCPCRAPPTRASWGRVQPPGVLCGAPPAGLAAHRARPALLTALQSAPSAGAIHCLYNILDTRGAPVARGDPGVLVARDTRGVPGAPVARGVSFDRLLVGCLVGRLLVGCLAARRCGPCAHAHPRTCGRAAAVYTLPRRPICLRGVSICLLGQRQQPIAARRRRLHQQTRPAGPTGSRPVHPVCRRPTPTRLPPRAAGSGWRQLATSAGPGPPPAGQPGLPPGTQPSSGWRPVGDRSTGPGTGPPGSRPGLPPGPTGSATSPATAPSPVPTSARAALRDPHWRAAQEEYDALQRNRTWELVPRPCANVITGKWVFKHKLGSDGTLERYKARWVVRGFGSARRRLHGYVCPGCQTGHDPHGVAPRRVSCMACIGWTSPTPSFMAICRNRCTVGSPSASSTPSAPMTCACSLGPVWTEAGAPRWYQRIAGFLHQLGFHSTSSDASLFVYRTGHDMAYLLLYVDDIIRRPPLLDFFDSSPTVFALSLR